MRHIMHAADGQKHMTRIKRSGGTGTAGGSLDAHVVEHEQQRFAFNAFKTETDIAGQAFFRVPVECTVRDLRKPGDEPVPHAEEVCRVFRHFFDGLLQGGGHGADPGDILRAGPPAALLRPAFNQRGEAYAALCIQEAHTFGTVKLVGGGGEEVNVVFDDTDRNMADGLNGIGVEQDILFPADFSDLPDRLDGADFIVGIHDGHKAGILADRGFHLGRHDQSVFMYVQEGDFKALLFQSFQCMQHRVMFKGGGDDMHFAFRPADFSGGTDRLIVRFASAGSEGDFARIGSDGRCNLSAGIFQDSLCLLSVFIQAGRVAPGFFKQRGHGLDGFLAHPGCGCVICVDHSQQLLSYRHRRIIRPFTYYVNR